MSLPTALATPTPRLTRSKRALDVMGVSGNGKIYSTDGSTVTTVKRTSISHTTTNNAEKDNISPLTNSEPLQPPTPEFTKPIKGHGGSVDGTKFNMMPAKDQNKRAAKAGSTTSRVKKSNYAIPTPGEQETIAGRLLAMKRREAPGVKLARKLTVRPLADLSEVAKLPIVSDNVTSTGADAPTQEQGTLEPKDQPQTAQVEEKLSTRALIAPDLHATLRLSAQTTDEYGRFPDMLQRPSRGVKRVLDFSENTNELKQIKKSSHSSRFARPAKRMRKSPVGSETPKVTSTVPSEEDASIPRVPQSICTPSGHVSPSANESHVEVPVPMPAFDLPDSISESVLTSTSTSLLIPIPPTSLHDVFRTSSNQEDTEKESEATQDQTPLSLDTAQGYRFSSVFESRIFHFEESLYAPPRSGIEGGRSEEAGIKMHEGLGRTGCNPIIPVIYPGEREKR